MPTAARPPLWATYGGRLPAIEWLLAHGADVNLERDFGGSGHGTGATALHVAAQFGNLATTALLIARGADRTLRDTAYEGTTAEWAEESGIHEAARLLGG